MSTSELRQRVREIKPSPVGCGSLRMFQVGLVDGFSYPEADLLDAPVHAHAFHLGQRLGRRCVR